MRSRREIEAHDLLGVDGDELGGEVAPRRPQAERREPLLVALDLRTASIPAASAPRRIAGSSDAGITRVRTADSGAMPRARTVRVTICSKGSRPDLSRRDERVRAAARAERARDQQPRGARPREPQAGARRGCSREIEEQQLAALEPRELELRLVRDGGAVAGRESLARERRRCRVSPGARRAGRAPGAATTRAPGSSSPRYRLASWWTTTDPSRPSLEATSWSRPSRASRRERALLVARREPRRLPAGSRSAGSARARRARRCTRCG